MPALTPAPPLADGRPEAGRPQGHAALTRPGTGHEDLRDSKPGWTRSSPTPLREHRIDWSRVLPPVAARRPGPGLAAATLVRRQPRATRCPARSTCWASSARSGCRARCWKPSGPALQRGILGFLSALVIGTPLGLLVAGSPSLRRAFGPIISGPAVAAVGGLGAGRHHLVRPTDATMYFVIFMGAVPSIVNGLISGVDQIPPLYRGVGHGAGRDPARRGAADHAARPRCPATSRASSRAGRSPGAR